jgi:hypothetical protein
MAWSAPSDRPRSTFVVLQTPVTNAPIDLAICTANVPTPPDAPMISTLCLGRTWPLSRSGALRRASVCDRPRRGRRGCGPDRAAREGLAPQTVHGFAQIEDAEPLRSPPRGDRDRLSQDAGESGEAVKTSPDVSSSRAFPSWSARRAGRARSLTVRCLPCKCRRAESPPRAVLGTATRTGRSARPRNRRDRHA